MCPDINDPKACSNTGKNEIERQLFTLNSNVTSHMLVVYFWTVALTQIANCWHLWHVFTKPFQGSGTLHFRWESLWLSVYQTSLHHIEMSRWKPRWMRWRRKLRHWESPDKVIIQGTPMSTPTLNDHDSFFGSSSWRVSPKIIRWWRYLQKYYENYFPSAFCVVQWGILQ